MMNQLLDKFEIKDAKKLISFLKSELFSLYKLTPKIGVELEYYLVHQDCEIDEALKKIKLNCDRLDKERGWNQFESVLEYSDDIDAILEALELLKSSVSVSSRQYGIKSVFEAKPFDDDYGSALHFHLSMHDENMINAFADNEYESNKLLNQIIAGILDISSESLYLLSNSDEDFKRFEEGGYLSPSHVSWGGNNRTTIIRIPDSHPINRRIEFRLPHASSDPAIAIAIMLIGALHGLNNLLQAPDRIYGNAYDEKYELQRLPLNMEEAKNQFEKSGKIEHYISEFMRKGKMDD